MDDSWLLKVIEKGCKLHFQHKSHQSSCKTLVPSKRSKVRTTQFSHPQAFKEEGHHSTKGIRHHRRFLLSSLPSSKEKLFRNMHDQRPKGTKQEIFDKTTKEIGLLAETYKTLFFTLPSSKLPALLKICKGQRYQFNILHVSISIDPWLITRIISPVL